MRKTPNETALEKLNDGPVRRCVLTGESRPAEELVRLALGPDGSVLPDALAKAPGRGAWLGVDRVTLEKALAKGQLKGALARAFKTGSLQTPAGLPERIESALRRAALDRLGLESRAGRLVTGSEKIEVAARRGQVAMLLHAADAANDGCARLDQAWRMGCEEGRTVPASLRLPVDRNAVSMALGRGNVVHIAVTDRRAAERIGWHLHRWLRFIGPAGDREWQEVAA